MPLVVCLQSYVGTLEVDRLELQSDIVGTLYIFVLHEPISGG